MDDKALAKKLSEPIESSAERSKKPGNTHPIPPEKREDTLSGNTATADQLAALETQKRMIEERIDQVEKDKDKIENTELYKRDLKVLKMSKAGELPGQNVGKIATEQEEPRAKAEKENLQKVEDNIRNVDESKKATPNPVPPNKK